MRVAIVYNEGMESLEAMHNSDRSAFSGYLKYSTDVYPQVCGPSTFFVGTRLRSLAGVSIHHVGGVCIAIIFILSHLIPSESEWNRSGT